MNSRTTVKPGTLNTDYRHKSAARKKTIAIAAIAALTLSACTTSGSSGEAGTASNSPASGGTFNIGIGNALDTLDPAQQTTTTVQNVVDYTLEALVTLSPKGKVEPLLATSWKTSADGLALTFSLRKDVKFQDGTPFNAAAVKYSLDRLISGNIKVPIGGAYQVIKSVDAVNPTTVKLNLKNPDPGLLANMTTTVAAIFSPGSVGKFGNKATNIVHPVGTGPYEYVSRVRGSSLTLKRFAGYWGSKPYYSGVVFQIIPEGTSRESALKSGQVDLILNPPLADLTSLSSSDGITVAKLPDDRSIFLTFNETKAPFNNVKVRQAFNYAVDKKSLIKNVLFDAVTPMDSPFPTSMQDHCTAGNYDYNPTKAKQLLKEAGVTNLSVTLGSPSGRYQQDIQTSQAIAGFLAKVGVKVQVKTSDFPTYVSTITDKNGPYDFHMLGWAPGANDAATQMQMFLKRSWPPAGLNSGFVDDPEVEALFAKASVNLDDKSRSQQYCQIQKALWTDAPWVFLWSQTLILAYKSNIAGISYQPNEKFVTVGAHPK